MMNIFDTVLVYPITNALLFIYHFLNLMRVPFALGFSIIGLTIIIRLILYPLTSSQIKASKKMMDLNPHIKNLKEKHKNDAKTLQAETMKLYKEHGVNPAAGCLPILIQLPVIWGLYSVLNTMIHLGASNLSQINNIAYADFLKLTRVWDANFFGMLLTQTPQRMFSTSNPATWLILLVPILTGVFQLIQSKMMLSAVPATADKKIAEVKNGEKSKEDFSSAMQTQMTYLMPVMIGFFSFNFPIGLSLYWNTFTIFGIIQQYKVAGLGGLKEWINKIYGGI
jgi:YidC/Oxa1 family membrane protein insertase